MLCRSEDRVLDISYLEFFRIGDLSILSIFTQSLYCYIVMNSLILILFFGIQSTITLFIHSFSNDFSFNHRGLFQLASVFL